jgi:hypothetical protein
MIISDFWILYQLILDHFTHLFFKNLKQQIRELRKLISFFDQ